MLKLPDLHANYDFHNRYTVQRITETQRLIQKKTIENDCCQSRIDDLKSNAIRVLFGFCNKF